MDLVGERLGDEVDAGVALVETLPLGPRGVGLDAPIELAVHGLVLQEGDGQLLEVRALLAVGRGGAAETVEEVVECAHAPSSHVVAVGRRDR